MSISWLHNNIMQAIGIKDGAKQMANNFPLGPGQRLALGNISLTLESCDFDPTGPQGLAGYTVRERQDTLPELAYSITGVPQLKGPGHKAKYDFEWSLLLSAEKAYTLDAIFKFQKQLISMVSENPGLIVFDERLAFNAYANPSRTRAKVGTAPVPNAPTPAPANFEFIYPVWQVLITSFEWSPFILPGDIYKISMTAQELNALGTDADETTSLYDT